MNEVTRWFFDNIEDHVYSEALYELMQILDNDQLLLWTQIYVAEGNAEKFEDELGRLEEELRKKDELIEELKSNEQSTP